MLLLKQVIKIYRMYAHLFSLCKHSVIQKIRTEIPPKVIFIGLMKYNLLFKKNTKHVRKVFFNIKPLSSLCVI